jgi:hypothetical protein
MPEVFVPFLSKANAEKGLPQYTFQQYNLSRVKLAHAPKPPPPSKEELKKKF